MCKRKAKGQREFTLPLWLIALGFLLGAPACIGILFGFFWAIWAFTNVALWTGIVMLAASIVVFYITAQEVRPSDKWLQRVFIFCITGAVIGVALIALATFAINYPN